MLILFALLLGAAHTAPNACQVLSKRDVAAVQGKRYESAKLTETSKHGVQISQCLYRMPMFSESVSVDVIRGNARQFWEKHFKEAGEEKETKPVATKNGNDPDERVSHARRIEGVGNEAVWSGNKIAGSLYVLKGDTVLRVSVGGGATQEQKIEKSKKLALRALRRL